MNNKLSDGLKNNILVVDDVPHNLLLLKGLLSMNGYQVRLAKSGCHALESVKMLLPDLILLDVMMPEMDGYQVCQRLKAHERTRDIPVIFVSACDDAPAIEKGFALGGAAYITKPFQTEELLSCVQTHLAPEN
jgi:CheY-like chemotaxis protein